MGSDTELTPMMAQYRRIKGELPGDALLLFRLGDFYELFFEDARIGAQLLNVALTKRGDVPMCGIPFHAAGGYVAKLLKAGRKVAICDQMEDARSGQLVKREVTQILSPGTHFDERMLSAERNNFLACVYAVGSTFGLALVDLTTGDFLTTEVEGETALLTELQRLRPAELVYPSEAANLTRLSFYQRTDFLTVDFATLRHLEIMEPLHHDSARNASLFGALNRTMTPMGARRLRHWLSQPLAKREPIQQRQQVVQTF